MSQKRVLLSAYKRYVVTSADVTAGYVELYIETGKERLINIMSLIAWDNTNIWISCDVGFWAHGEKFYLATGHPAIRNVTFFSGPLLIRCDKLFYRWNRPALNDNLRYKYAYEEVEE